jgi:hypothetical protein
MFSKNILSNITKLSKGELSPTEMYNMKKNLTEVLLFSATVFLASSLGGDDDEGKRRRSNPFSKLGLTLANRAAGDLDFFYSPNQIADIGKNIIPLAKFGQEILKTIEYIPYAIDYNSKESKFSSGVNKDKNKALVQLTKQIPGLSAILQGENILNSNTITFQ